MRIDAMIPSLESGDWRLEPGLVLMMLPYVSETRPDATRPLFVAKAIALIEQREKASKQAGNEGDCEKQADPSRRTLRCAHSFEREWLRRERLTGTATTTATTNKQPAGGGKSIMESLAPCLDYCVARQGFLIWFAIFFWFLFRFFYSLWFFFLRDG